MKSRLLPTKLLWFSAFIFLLQSTACVQNETAELDAGIGQLMEEYQAVGLSVAVVKDGDLHYTKAFGYQNLETEAPLQEDHLFRIASISKSFTSTAIMQYVEDGEISLDSDIGDLIGFPVRNPNFPDEVITLRMVLSHTSSISDKAGYFTLDVIDPSKNPEWENAFNDYAPGTEYQYCNLNFNMLGAVLERLSGERFDVLINQEILRPLGLYGGYAVDSLQQDMLANIYAFNAETGEFKDQPNAYHPRREELKEYELGYSAPVFSPTGGMKISAPDLARYMIMHMNYGIKDGVRILEEASAREMQKPVSDSGYGLALTNTSTYIAGEEMVGHTGSAYGLYSNMFFSPDKKFGFVLITNGCDAQFEDGYVALLKKTADLLYEQFIQ